MILWNDAVTDTRRDVLPLTADLTAAELAEALGALRFHGRSRCLVSLVSDTKCASRSLARAAGARAGRSKCATLLHSPATPLHPLFLRTRAAAIWRNAVTSRV